MNLAVAKQERRITRSAELFDRFAPDTNIQDALKIDTTALDSLKENGLLDEQQHQEALTTLKLESERQRQAALIELRRAGWEQELLEEQGFMSRTREAEAAHQQRLIGIRYRYANEQGQVQKLITDVTHKEGVKRVQSALELTRVAAANLGAHNKKAFQISQAAAIANATISTYESVQDAYKSGLKINAPAPIPQIAAVGFAAAALTAGLARVAAIRAQQPPQAFAKGGVVDKPTFFSAGNVRRGLAGEAGPEAILPLRRLRNGRLGVESTGGGRQVVNFAPVFHIAIQGQVEDAAATGQEIGQQIRAELAPIVRTLLASELRPGGLLNKTDEV